MKQPDYRNLKDSGVTETCSILLMLIVMSSCMCAVIFALVYWFPKLFQARVNPFMDLKSWMDVPCKFRIYNRSNGQRARVQGISYRQFIRDYGWREEDCIGTYIGPGSKPYMITWYQKEDGFLPAGLSLLLHRKEDE